MPAESPLRASPVDTDALMHELRMRLAEKKARGLYRTDALVRDTLDQGTGPEVYERLRVNAVLHQSLAVPASTRPGIGKLIEFAKRFVLRASFLNVQAIVEQQSRVNGDLIAEVRRISEDLDDMRGERSQRADAIRIEQDAAVGRRAAALGCTTIIESRALLAVAHDATHSVLAASAALVDGVDAVGLGALVRDLARVMSVGGTLLLAPGGSDPVALAALLTAVGFGDAVPEEVDGPVGERVVIVVAHR